MTRLLIIADDLSGAADCAIGFASAGRSTVVTLDPTRLTMDEDADTIAIDTDTRRLTPEAAAARTAAAYAEICVRDQRLYKKIDSTLRGNWAAEVAGLHTLAGMAIVAPAFPATGRTVRDGHVYVHGEPLERTATWQLEHAGRPAGLAAQLAAAGLCTALLDAEPLRDDPQRLATAIDTLAEAGTQALIVDAQSARALNALACATLHSDAEFFWVGSGGLAREIAALDASEDSGLARRAASRNDTAAEVFPGGPILILVGSLSTVSERQCTVLREQGGVEEWTVPPALLRRAAAHADWPAWQARIGAALAAGRDLLLRIGRDDAFDLAESMQLSTALAALVEPHFAKAGGLIATGGETARAMLTAARIGNLRLLAEVETGVAVARPLDAAHPHRPGVVTKAGAFGTDRALYAAWRTLRNETEPNVAAR